MKRLKLPKLSSTTIICTILAIISLVALGLRIMDVTKMAEVSETRMQKAQAFYDNGNYRDALGLVIDIYDQGGHPAGIRDLADACFEKVTTHE